MQDDITFRRPNPDEMAAAYEVCCRSVHDYLFRIGLADEATAKDPPVSDAWTCNQTLVEHLWYSAAENWVAADKDGRLVGWAQSIERDDHLELTTFYVLPGSQSRGVGHELIARAFPRGRGRHRLIVASQDPRALSLYLRSGVGFVGASVEVTLTPQPTPDAPDLTFERLDPGTEAAAALAMLEAQVIGFRREVDLACLLRTRPAWIARRHGTPIGFAFGLQMPPPDSSTPPVCGPMAALEAADMPALIDQILRTAGTDRDFEMAVPLPNQVAMTHILARGGKITPFYTLTLSDSPGIKLDRFIHTTPDFFL